MARPRKVRKDGKKHTASPPAPAPEAEAVDAHPVVASPGALPRKKPALDARTKAAVERAEKRARGEDPGVGPPVPGAVIEAAPGEGPRAEPARGEFLATLDRIVAIPEEKEDTPKIGRPSTYKPEYAVITKELCEEGFTDSELQDFFGISESTFRRWRNTHLEFRRGLVLGKAVADDAVERDLYHNARNHYRLEEKVFCKDGVVTRVPQKVFVAQDLGAAKMWLGNRRPDKWKVGERAEANDRREEIERSTVDLARRLASVFSMVLQAQQAPQPTVIEHEASE